MKAKAKEIQRIEQETIRHQEANRTALEAIGGPKKRKFGEVGGSGGAGVGGGGGGKGGVLHRWKQLSDLATADLTLSLLAAAWRELQYK